MAGTSFFSRRSLKKRRRTCSPDSPRSRLRLSQDKPSNTACIWPLSTSLPMQTMNPMAFLPSSAPALEEIHGHSHRLPPVLVEIHRGDGQGTHPRALRLMFTLQLRWAAERSDRIAAGNEMRREDLHSLPLRAHAAVEVFVTPCVPRTAPASAAASPPPLWFLPCEGESYRFESIQRWPQGDQEEEAQASQPLHPALQRGLVECLAKTCAEESRGRNRLSTSSVFSCAAACMGSCQPEEGGLTAALRGLTVIFHGKSLASLPGQQSLARAIVEPTATTTSSVHKAVVGGCEGSEAVPTPLLRLCVFRNFF